MTEPVKQEGSHYLHGHLYVPYHNNICGLNRPLTIWTSPPHNITISRWEQMYLHARRSWPSAAHEHLSHVYSAVVIVEENLHVSTACSHHFFFLFCYRCHDNLSPHHHPTPTPPSSSSSSHCATRCTCNPFTSGLAQMGKNNNNSIYVFWSPAKNWWNVNKLLFSYLRRFIFNKTADKYIFFKNIYTYLDLHTVLKHSRS